LPEEGQRKVMMAKTRIIKGSGGRGKIMAIGGAEELEGKCEILARFVELAGGDKARIIVMTVATNLVKELGDEYTKIFKRLGASNVKAVDVSSREQASSQQSLKELEQATGVFFTGGDQLQVTSLIGGSEMDRLLHRKQQLGVIIAGTSAGAAMMSNTMIVTGPPKENPRLGTVQLGPGMEFFLGGVIDTHFSQRGRHGRLLTIVAQYPHDLGIGIDEDTAIIVDGEEFEVIGNGAVTVIDAGSLSYSNVPLAGEHDSLALFDIRLHALPAGHFFDLRNRRPVIPDSRTNKAGHARKQGATKKETNKSAKG
jgi:cyanophycinase